MIANKYKLPKHIEPTYEGIGEAAFGAVGRLVVQFTVAITQCGFCTAYVVFIAQNMNSLVPALGFVQWTFVILPLIVLLSWIRQLKYLAPFAMFANFCLLYGVVVVIVRTAQVLHFLPELPSVQPINISTFLVFLGMAIFAFEGVGLVCGSVLCVSFCPFDCIA